MSQEIVPQVFRNDEFGEIRAAGTPDRPEFCAKDVAKALGYKDATNAVKLHCRGVAIYHPITDSLGRTQDARFVTEGDMYRLIASSKLEGAQRFESWVFDDVLPAIRRDGGYMTAGQDETPEQLMARALKVADEALRRRDARIAALEPRAGMFDACMDGERWSSFTEAARLLRQYDGSMTRSLLLDLAYRDRLITRDHQASRYGVDRGYVVNYQPPAYFDQKTGEQVRPKPYAKFTSRGLSWAAGRYCSREMGADR